MRDKDFKNLTKKQKLFMAQTSLYSPVKCSKLLFIPIRKKMDGWGMAASYGLTENGWVRFSDYDCFRFTKVEFLKGDFEYDGVVFFLGEDAFVHYGNEITINKTAR